ncbi:MAG: undecaprenyl/decaprenyl-phosphate alpha-N-acetylglucosaminyl 1-phosphate transferase [Nitrospirota bacterium]|nr:undecaprenyl/decaprenyl-phosphate alpha-N-acetylglucosaminyl 1-phosphate transferase [Nitrospirota bacterium]
MFLLILTFLLAFFLSLYGVPVARAAALKYGIVDSPDGRLKHQREPVPYLGGLAIYLAFLISLAFTFEFRHDVLGIVLAGTLVLLLGLIDDFGVLSPSIKLMGQFLAVFVLIKSGIRVNIAVLPDWLDLALTVVWMLGIINAFNLLDIMDGLAAGVGFVCAACLLTVALLNGDQTLAFMLTALAGSLLGFLRYNFRPALIYMGDAGAMFIGLMLGAVSMIGQYQGSHPLALLSPAFILGVPLLDTIFVIYMRLSRGVPVFMGSPDHLALRLRRHGFPVPVVVSLMYGASTVLGGIGLALLFVDMQLAAALVGLTGLAFIVTTLVMKRVDVTVPGPMQAAGPVVAVPADVREERVPS